MAFVQKYVYTPPEGTELITMPQWCLTALNDSDKDKLMTILKSRDGLVAMCKSLGYLVTSFNDGDIFAWDTEEHATSMFPSTAEYEQFHARYLEETGTTFQLVTETV